MPWFHQILTKLVEVHVNEKDQYKVLDGLFNSVALVSVVNHPQKPWLNVFTLEPLIESLNLQPSELWSSSNIHFIRLLRQFNLAVKRIIFDMLCSGKDERYSQQEIANRISKELTRKMSKRELSKEGIINLNLKLDPDKLKKTISSIIGYNIEYFRNENSYLTFEAKLDILSKFHIYLAERKGEVNPKSAMNFFWGLCVYYANLRESESLVVFENQFLEQSSPSFHNNVTMHALESIQRNTLGLLEQYSSLDLKPLGIFSAYHVDQKVIDAMIEEAKTGENLSRIEKSIPELSQIFRKRDYFASCLFFKLDNLRWRPVNPGQTACEDSAQIQTHL